MKGAQGSLWLTADAAISPCGRYRTRLRRVWAEDEPSCVFIGLNPSTADGTTDDPTIRRCVAFARRWDYGSLVMVNLYGYRSPEPAALWPRWPMSALDPTGGDPIGPDALLWSSCREAGIVIAAWGTFPKAALRAQVVMDVLHQDGVPLHVLGLTADGSPRHPLYIRADVRPQLWKPGRPRDAG